MAPKPGAGAAPPPNVGAGAENVELVDPPPKGLAFGAGALELLDPPPKLKTPAEAGGLWAVAPKLNPALEAALDDCEEAPPPPKAKTPPVGF